jgi:hypothetical protein
MEAPMLFQIATLVAVTAVLAVEIRCADPGKLSWRHNAFTEIHHCAISAAASGFAGTVGGWH